MRLAKTGFFRKAAIDSPTIERELNLHRAVLDKALIDSFSPRDEIRLEVEEWLHLNNPDFIFACDRALLDPEGVYKTFKLFKQILKGNKARFRKFGKRNNDDEDNEE